MDYKYKHICNLEYCKIHSQCIFKNAITNLKNNAYIVSLGDKINADLILCYQKESLELNKKEIAPILYQQGEREIELKSKSELFHCENPICNSLSDLKYNDKVHLCFDCLDKLRKYKTNYELSKYFSYRHQLIKLLKEISLIENPEKEKFVVRCSNIYCGTDVDITQHHLIPNPYRKNIEGGNRKIPLCWKCHTEVHKLKTNKELAFNFNTKESVIKLLASDVKFRIERMMTVVNNTNNNYAMVA